MRDKGRGARRDEGVFTTNIDFPGAGGATVAQAINNRGQLLGFYNPSEATASKRGFLLDDGECTTIDHPDATSEVEGGGTALLGLNDRGQIVGQYSDLSCHGFLLDGDAFTTIDLPDASFAEAAGINGRGQIVGPYLNAEGTIYGFLRDGGHGRRRETGVFTTIDVPGALATSADHLNN